MPTFVAPDYLYERHQILGSADLRVFHFVSYFRAGFHVNVVDLLDHAVNHPAHHKDENV